MIAQEYSIKYGPEAARRFTEDLMRGDAARFKAGYSADNAIIAAAEIFELESPEIESLVDDIQEGADLERVLRALG